MKSIFEHKPELKLSEFVIEKTITVPNEDFEQMLHCPMDGQPFIEENKELIYQDDEDMYHCILVTGKDRTDGIFVECEGYGYARYASYVPETSAIGYTSLAKLNRKLTAAVDFIIENGIHQAKDLYWKLSYDELENYTGLCLKDNLFLQEIVGDMLCDRFEIKDLSLDDDCLQVIYSENCNLEFEDKGYSFTPKINI